MIVKLTGKNLIKLKIKFLKEKQSFKLKITAPTCFTVKKCVIQYKGRDYGIK